MNNPPGNRYDYKVSNKNQLRYYVSLTVRDLTVIGAKRIWQQFN